MDGNGGLAMWLLECEQCDIVFTGHIRRTTTDYSPENIEKLRNMAHQNYDCAFCPSCGGPGQHTDAVYYLRKGVERLFASGSNAIPKDELLTQFEELYEQFLKETDRTRRSRIQEMIADLIENSTPEIMDILDVASDFSLDWTLVFPALIFAFKMYNRQTNRPLGEIFEESLWERIRKYMGTTSSKKK